MALSQHPVPAASRSRRRWTRIVGFGLASAALSAGIGLGVHAQSKDDNSPAQSAGEKSVDEKLKAVERERDELKGRNADLELKLKQLQATVDNLVHQALGERPATPPFSPPPSAGSYSPRPQGPFVTRFRPMFSPFSGLPDPLELAIAFSNALGEREAAKPALEAAKVKVGMGRGGSRFDVAASAQLLTAERKVRLLRNIVATARRVAADEAERVRKLGAVRAVSMAEVRNAEARLKILDEILASDPDAPKTPAVPATSTRSTATKPLLSD
jgi:hypothetical protein